MSETKLRIYTVHVTEQRKFWGSMNIRAADALEAQERAFEEFQWREADSDHVDIDIEILSAEEA